MIKNILLTGTLGITLVACSQIPKEAYFSRGQPESLMDVSSEVVNLSVDSPESVQEITAWLDKDQPTRAELSCHDGNLLCSQVRNILHQFGVAVKPVSSPGDKVALIYERVVARDCEGRYIDNMVNPYNLNHPTFGCTLSANMVQMISDKRQITNPALMEKPDAEKMRQSVGFASLPADFTPPKLDSNFQAIATQENISASDQGGGGGGGGPSR